MAINFGGTTAAIHRSGSYLDPTLDWTVSFWLNSTVTGPTGGAAYKVYYIWGDETYTSSYIFVGSQVNTNNIGIEISDVATSHDTIYIALDHDAWHKFGMVYDATGHTLKFYLDGILKDTLTSVDFSTYVFATKNEYMGGDTSGSFSDIGVGYVGLWQRAFTLTDLNNQWASQFPVSNTNLLSFTQLSSPAQKIDSSGNFHAWSLDDPTDIIILAGPLVNDFSVPILLCFAQSNIYNQSLIGYNLNTDDISIIQTPPSTEVAGETAVRSSDGHIFIFGATGVVYEFDENLVYVQQFGVPSTSAPGTLYPTNNSWDQIFIQFTTNFAWLGWAGSGGNLGNIAIQKRHLTTFALISQDIAFSGSLLGTSNVPLVVSPDETTLYLCSVGGTGNNQNIVYKYTFAGPTLNPLFTYSTWSVSTGWRVSNIAKTFPNGDIAILFFHFTAGVSNDAHILVITDAGVQLYDVALATSPDIAKDFALDTSNSTVWVTGSFDETVPDIFRKYNLVTGVLLDSFNSQTQRKGGMLLFIPSSVMGTLVVGKASGPVNSQLFDILSPGLSPTSFTIGFEGTQEFAVSPGTYSIEEVIGAGYFPTYYVSNDPVNNDNTAIVVGVGETVDVVIVNMLQTEFGGLYTFNPRGTLKHDNLVGQDLSTVHKMINWFFQLFLVRDK